MARKKEPEKAANHERWLVSYADFITLLFAVFVTLYAMSQTDKKKVEQVAASYRSAFGITSGTSSGKCFEAYVPGRSLYLNMKAESYPTSLISDSDNW